VEELAQSASAFEQPSDAAAMLGTSGRQSTQAPRRKRIRGSLSNLALEQLAEKYGGGNLSAGEDDPLPLIQRSIGQTASGRPSRRASFTSVNDQEALERGSKRAKSLLIEQTTPAELEKLYHLKLSDAAVRSCLHERHLNCTFWWSLRLRARSRRQWASAGRFSRSSAGRKV
jgi:hypothetical protein